MSDGTIASDAPSALEQVEGRIARLCASLPGSWLLRMVRERPRMIDGLTLDAHVQFILAARRRKPQVSMCGPTVRDARLRYRRDVAAVTGGSGAQPTPVGSVRDLTLDGDTGPLHARHYAPPTRRGRENGSGNGTHVTHVTDTARKPLLVFFHGGGFVLGDLDTHDEPCRMLAHHGDMHVLSVAYRLAPEHPFPAPVQDADAAVRWAQANAASLGADPDCICVGGDSAGGNLATVVALQSARDGRRVAAQLLIYPTTDATMAHPSRAQFGNGFVLTDADMDAFVDRYVGGDDSLRHDARVSPAISPDLVRSPPALLITAGFDPLRDEGEAYAAALSAAGAIARMRRVPGLVHGFLHMTNIVPAARDAVIDMARRFRELLDESRQRSVPGLAGGP